VSTPDRAAALREHESWARGKAHRPEPAVDTRTHSSEIRAGHSGLPSVETQSRTHGAPLPGVDKGPDSRGGAR
jgi:hypothetical protein